MDFPLDLETLTFVTGEKELRQCCVLALKEMQGKFLFNAKYGSRVSVHMEPDIICENIEISLKRIKGLTVNSVKFDGTDFDTIIKYNGLFYNFKFGVEEIYDR